MKMGVVADDITGANDIGIMFAKAGLLTHVYAYEKPGDFALVGDPDIVILDTNSRLDLPPVAYDKVHAATRDLMAAGCRQFHNKTCSVFRGNIGVEFDAMLDALDLDFAVVVLGFPKNGRRTVEGVHYVHGRRLEESEFRNDPIHPMTRSDLVGILGAQTQRAVGLIDYTVVARGAADLRAEIGHRQGQQNYVIIDVVDQGAAGHAAGGGAHQRFPHLAAVVVVQPDVEHQMHVFPRGVDVGDHRSDGGIRVGHQPRLVAGDRRVTGYRVADPKQIGIAGGADGGIDVDRRSRQLGKGLLQPRDSLAADAGLPDQKISQRAEIGQGHDDGQPGGARLRQAVRAQQNMRHGDQYDGDMQDQRQHQAIGRRAGTTVRWSRPVPAAPRRARR